MKFKQFLNENILDKIDIIVVPKNSREKLDKLFNLLRSKGKKIHPDYWSQDVYKRNINNNIGIRISDSSNYIEYANIDYYKNEHNFKNLIYKDIDKILKPTSKYVKQLKFESLNEEIYKTIKMEGYTLEIYKNPKNIEEITNKQKYIVRAFLKTNGDLFCWDGDTPALHDNLERILDIKIEDIALVFKDNKVGISFSMLPYNNPDDINIKRKLIKKVSNSSKVKKLADVNNIEFGEFN